MPLACYWWTEYIKVFRFISTYNSRMHMDIYRSMNIHVRVFKKYFIYISINKKTLMHIGGFFFLGGRACYSFVQLSSSNDYKQRWIFTAFIVVWPKKKFIYLSIYSTWKLINVIYSIFRLFEDWWLYSSNWLVARWWKITVENIFMLMHKYIFSLTLWHTHKKIQFSKST